MALSKIDGTNFIAPTIPVSAGGTGTTSYTAGITEADQWRLTANTNTGTSADVTSNWERIDTSGWGNIGTGLTESSGIFSFPSTGIYQILFFGAFKVDSGDTSADFEMYITTNNSSYIIGAVARVGSSGGGTPSNYSGSNVFLFDVTDTSTHKFKFKTGSFSGSNFLRGNTNEIFTNFVATRLGDT